jgi:hypothetical protein
MWQREKKQFFFEKKNQKTFVHADTRLDRRVVQAVKARK